MTATTLSNRALIRLSPLEEGEDVADFLQGLVTNDVARALPVWAGLLTPQGKVLFDFMVWRDGTDLLLDCEADAAEGLIKRLSIYRLRRKIGIVVDASLAVHWQSGSGPCPDPRLPALGQRWLGAPGGDAVDAAWLAHRLSLGVPEGSTELGDGETLWLECNAAELNGVSFTKGCYVGQENTARMNWRQKINRRLLVVPLARSDPARQRVVWPELGLALDHVRVEGLATELLPEWLQPA